MDIQERAEQIVKDMFATRDFDDFRIELIAKELRAVRDAERERLKAEERKAGPKKGAKDADRG